MKNNNLQVTIFPVTDLLSLAIANTAETIASVRNNMPLIGDDNDRSMAMMLSTNIKIILQRLKGSVGGKALTSFRNVERVIRSNGWDVGMMDDLVIKDVEEASSLGIMCAAIALKQILSDKLAEWKEALSGPLDDIDEKMDAANRFTALLYGEIMRIETLLEAHVAKRVSEHFRAEIEDHPSGWIRPVLVSATNLIGIWTPDNIYELLDHRYIKIALRQNRIQISRQWIDEIIDTMETIDQTAQEMADTKIGQINSIRDGIRTINSSDGLGDFLPGVNATLKGL